MNILPKNKEFDKRKEEANKNVTCAHCRKDITNNEDIINVFYSGGKLPFCSNKCFALFSK